MKKILFIVLMAILVLPAMAQSPDEYYIVDSSKTQSKPLLSKERLHFSTDLGTSFSSLGKKNSAFSNYLAPQMNYEVSNRFSLSVGTMFMSSRLSSQSESGLTTRNVFQNFMFVEGAYRASDRLTLTGSVMYETTSLLKRNTNSSTPTMNTSITTFGAEYRITDNIRIGVQIQQARGVSPFYNSMTNPYGW